MIIRQALKMDARCISKLLSQMDYPNTEHFMAARIEELSTSRLDYNLVLEEDHEIIGFISMHIIPQIAFESNFLRISYLVIDENLRSRGAGKLLEEYAENIAKEKQL